MPRLKILSVSEQNEFDSPPVLSGDNRKTQFRFNQVVQEMIKPIKSDNHRIGFVLMFYYFKIVQKFFPPQLFYSSIKFFDLSGIKRYSFTKNSS